MSYVMWLVFTGTDAVADGSDATTDAGSDPSDLNADVITDAGTDESDIGTDISTDINLRRGCEHHVP